LRKRSLSFWVLRQKKIISVLYGPRPSPAVSCIITLKMNGLPGALIPAGSRPKLKSGDDQ
ncbi:MAG: hypothetical protein KHY61_06925, partial [Sutterella wadsworthensis]|nr:hypothetical protein [Sutterella wadsworthensis]